MAVDERKIVERAVSMIKNDFQFEAFPKRKQMLAFLENSSCLDAIVNHFFCRYCALLQQKMEEKPSERFLALKMDYDTKVVPATVQNEAASVPPFLQREFNELSLVIHAVGAAVFSVSQAEINRVQREKFGPSFDSSGGVSDTTTLLMIAGGTLCHIIKRKSKQLSWKKLSTKQRSDCLLFLKIARVIRMNERYCT